MLDYSQTVEWMFQQLPMYQRIGADAIKKDLANIQKFSEALNNPEKQFASVHVAGTNGKGSTSHMLASILQEAGYKVGLYTSPHLKDYRERIRINGREISEESVVRFISRNKAFLEAHKLSFFEMSVGMAFDHFATEKVDIAVVEVGLGGRLDSTNIITPVLSVITNIGFDHTQMLGNTLQEIAGEKGGIIKKGVPVVISEKQPETEPVFRSIADRVGSEIIFAEDHPASAYQSDLKGNYQKKNIQAVVTAVNRLPQEFSVLQDDIKNGLLKVKQNTGLRGRWDFIKESPKVICDTAHNAEGLQWVMRQIEELSFEQLHIVLGVVNDKDLKKILPLFSQEAKYYFSKPDVPRGMEAPVLAEIAGKYGLIGEVYSSVSYAYETALQNASLQDLIFIGGSTFTVAEII